MFAALLFLAGCAGSRTQSFVDPVQAAGSGYDSLVVYAAFSDLGIEATFERALCRRLRARGLACTTLLAAAPPTRVQDAASRHAATRTSGAQATLVIELADMHNRARRSLSDGGPAYDISVVDNAGQTVAARLAIQAEPGRRSARQRAETLARAAVRELARQGLLAPGRP